jgi:hypothetical protein
LASPKLEVDDMEEERDLVMVEKVSDIIDAGEEPCELNELVGDGRRLI